MYKASNKEREPIYAVLQGRANAVAVVAGSRDYPNITGRVKFYQTSAGVLVYAEIMGLPLAVRRKDFRISYTRGRSVQRK